MIYLIDWRKALRDTAKVIVAIMVAVCVFNGDAESAFLFTLIIIAIELGNVVIALKEQNGTK